MASGELKEPVPLLKTHRLDRFNCGNDQLNEYLARFALTNHQSGSARTYVACRDKHVVGYYSLAFGSIEHQASTDRVRMGLPQHPIPIILLARLAVDLSEQGCGVGKGLLKDSLLRTLQAADIGGLRAMVVHAKDKQATKFYEKFGFEASPIDKFHLMLLLKDIRQSVGSV